ncbi:hypothetical protein ACTXT7_016094 [Hymenolepis weldensis]
MGRRKRVLLLCAEGVEEMEFITIADIISRSGIKVVTAGVDSYHGVYGRQGFYIRPDYYLGDLITHRFDAVILPGGEGAAQAFADSETVGRVLKEQHKRGDLVCAMCVSLHALKMHGIGYNCKITSYPSLKNELKNSYIYSDAPVVVDDNLVTSRGPGTTAYFALKIIELLINKTTSKDVAKSMLIT